MDSRTEPADPASGSAAEPEPPDAAIPAAASRDTAARAHPHGTAARPPLARELLLTAGLFVLRKTGRLQAADRTGEAFTDVHRPWGRECFPRLPDEGAVQDPLGLVGAGR